MVVLSKTDYLLFRECRKNAWMKLHRPDVYFASELSSFDKAIIETGNEVELYARQLFPGGVMIEGRDRHAQAITLSHTGRKTPVLFQPVFQKDGFLAALDVLKWDAGANGWLLYEVKATNEIDKNVHPNDLAFQWVLLSKMGIPVRRVHLIHLNSQYIRSGALNLTELFTIEDVTEAIQQILPETEIMMKLAKDYLSLEKEPAGHCDCIYRGRSRHCSTFRHNNPDVPEYGVHDIARIGMSKAKLAGLVDQGIFGLEEVPGDFGLTEIQRNQLEAYLTNRVLIRRADIAAELRKLVFPVYFLDYETCPAALPRFDGFCPYQQIPFQYSLHILESPAGKPRHEEFLSTTPGDPSAAMCASLQGHIGKTGSVVVWSKKFECTVNLELGERIPAAKPFLDSLNSRVYDLMDIFAKQLYVHKDFLGSTSIKHVLPALVPELSYADLAIREGGTASQMWDKITSSQTGQAEKSQIACDLKLYCERDTFAMVAIWLSLEKLTRA